MGGLAIITSRRPIPSTPKRSAPRWARSSPCPFSTFDTFEDYLKVAGTATSILLMLQAKKSVRDIKKEKPYSLIFGNEATGLDQSFLKRRRAAHHPAVLDDRLAQSRQRSFDCDFRFLD
jgi:tRNA G18 (ribose-2'-O)-methylase SpoU